MATTSPRWFHLLAGPNGAGKSTLYRALVREGILGPPLEFVNADLHERAHLQHIANPQDRSEAARAWADARRTALLAAHTPFASETVFSHPSKLALIEDAQRHGFTVALYIVALDDPACLLDRVAQRVREGGHPVPPERILARYPAHHGPPHAGRAMGRCGLPLRRHGRDRRRPRLVAVRTASATTTLAARLPAWAQRVLGTAGTE